MIHCIIHFMNNLTTLLSKLTTLIKSNNTYIIEGSLNRNLLAADARKYDTELLNLLQKEKELKEHFFADTDGGLVFKKDVFLQFIMNKEFLPDSYTKYKIKIGLGAEDGSLLSESGDVVLNWPYKDAVLEGGQDKEDQKRSEILFNEVLAPDQITRLLDNKVFTNWKRYDKNGEHNLEELKDDDNLIIRGNNLVVLHSLKKRYAGKVKLIYIDPPYYFRKNKSSETFQYNSNFKLSTWLTYIRNRLTISKELLSDDGSILVHMNEDGFAYLKILMSEVFGTDNFVETFIWRNTDNPDSLSKKSRAATEYIIAFEKKFKGSRQYVGKDTENGDGPILHTGNKVKTLNFPKGSISFKIPDQKISVGRPDRVDILDEFEIKEGLNDREVRLSGEFTWTQETLNRELSMGAQIIIKSDKFSVRAQKPEGKSMAPEKFIDETYLSKAIGVGSNEDANSHLKKMGLTFTNSKPESVVAFFIRAMTDENDIVMDYFMGSGTTAVVAHKMHRRYIGVEQMGYIDDTSIKRLQAVIAGEQGGVSSQFNWQGGGSFVYVNIMNNSNKFRKRVEAAKNDSDYLGLLKEATSSSFLSYRVDPKKLNEDEFRKLSAAEKRRLLLELIDNNTLYVNYEDINDPIFKVSERDKELNKKFYEKS